MQDAKKSPKCHLGTIPQICRAISSQLRHVSTVGKKLLSSNISSTCPHNMVNGPLAAEIVSLVWGTLGNFNGFRVLVALLHDTLVVGVSQTAALNRGRHLYSAGRPLRWALAHISSFFFLPSFFPRLISAATDWMSTILLHMAWPSCEFTTVSCKLGQTIFLLLRKFSKVRAARRRPGLARPAGLVGPRRPPGRCSSLAVSRFLHSLTAASITFCCRLFQTYRGAASGH